MDSLLGRLIGSARAMACAVVLAVVLLASPVHAQTGQPYETRTQAMIACTQRVAENNAILEANGAGWRWGPCTDVPSAKWVVSQPTDGRAGGQWPYLNFDENPCDGMGSSTQNFVGKTLNGFKTCMPNPQADGSSVSCGMVFHAISDPVRNDYGKWSTYGTLTPTGDVCGAGAGEGGGWTDSTGAPPAEPPPPVPQDPPGPPKDPPKLCGKVSCYDAKKGEYCTQGSSGPVCASGPPPNPGGSGPPPNGGACGSSGDVSLCAGKPQAPPPAPDKVPDPPTATRGTDDYTHADANTGANYHTSTTAYNNGGGSASSGAAAGDTAPPPPSSSSTGGAPEDKGDDSQASGGGDCNNPPSVSGSPALAMVARQAWETRCSTDKVHKDLAGDGTASPGDITTPSGGSVWVNTPASGDATADAANKGNYDSSGMGFTTTCPMHDLQVPLWDGRSFVVPLSRGCPIGTWIRALVIAFALFAAAKITVGGNN